VRGTGCPMPKRMVDQPPEFVIVRETCPRAGGQRTIQ
jgi:hypothetical protein